MRSYSRLITLAGLAVTAMMVAAACSTAAATTAPTDTVAGATATPAAAGSAAAGTLTLAETTSSTIGVYLTGQGGMTLYAFNQDTPNTSTCTGSCATNWPPLVVAAGTTVTGPSDATMAFGTTTRSDGTIQVTYNQHPLYYFGGDSKAGDTGGQGKFGLWFVASPTGVLGSAPSATAAAPSYGY
jgi:predicted lipoprotein with Yx(FWY)xxD motif